MWVLHNYTVLVSDCIIGVGSKFIVLKMEWRGWH